MYVRLIFRDGLEDPLDDWGTVSQQLDQVCFARSSFSVAVLMFSPPPPQLGSSQIACRAVFNVALCVYCGVALRY